MPPGSSPVVLVSSEAVRPRMAGIGLRYAGFARQLAGAGLPVHLISPARREEMEAVLGEAGVAVSPFEPGSIAALLRGARCVVAQGQLANDVVLACPQLPTAIDLYDPFLIENLHYLGSLGLDPYRNDHATWLLQLSRGDFFLCSSEEQRLFYLGFLAALGRVNPESVARDPTAERLIAAVPFVLPESLPPYRPLLAARAPGERRVFLGGLYDWYDPWTLLEALQSLAPEGSHEGIDWRLLLVRHPNPEATPQRLAREVERRLREDRRLARRLVWIDWVEAERRFDLLRDVDVLAAPHRPGIETDLSLRTRYLDAWMAGCPVVTTAGGTVARLIAETGAGWVVPPGDARALALALRGALEAPGAGAAAEDREQRIGAGRCLVAERFQGAAPIAALVRFCREPWSDATKERFAANLVTRAPADALGFRLRRAVRRRLRRFQASPGEKPS